MGSQTEALFHVLDYEDYERLFLFSYSLHMRSEFRWWDASKAANLFCPDSSRGARVRICDGRFLHQVKTKFWSLQAI